KLPLSIQRGAPSSTLVPYTTLFRSAFCGVSLRHCSGQAEAQSTQRGAANAKISYHRGTEHTEKGARLTQSIAPCPPCLCGKKGIDRKSTRLNSSHVKISYAVFCLKK